VLAAIKRFFDTQIGAQVATLSSGDHALHLASAALLVEVTRADHEIKGEEREAVSRSLEQLFGLSRAEVTALLDLAEREVEQSADLYQFTSLVHQSFTLEQKIMVVELLWRVVFADGVTDKYEEATVRKIAELLYVPHPDFIAAKHRARQQSE